MHDAFFGGATAGTYGGAGAAGGRGASLVIAAPPADAASTRATQQQQQQQAILFGANALTSPAPASRGAASGAAAGSGAPARPTARPATNNWSRPPPSLTAGGPAAVLARGSVLAASAPSGGVAAGGAFSGSPISLALARPLASRPAAATFDDAADAMPLRDMRTAGYFVDAGLGMGRGFRVGWGPGGMLVIPGAADATRPTEICIARVRVEGQAAAYGDSSDSDARGLEGLREWLRAALNVHLAASAPDDMEPAGTDDTVMDGGAAAAAAAATAVPRWRLRVDARQLPILVEQYAAVCERQLQRQQQQGAGGPGADGGAGTAAADADDDADGQRLRHQVDTWRLVDVLFGHIEGELPDPHGLGCGGDGEEVADGAAEAGGGQRTVLAAMQRRAQVSMWLQRQAKGRVEAALGGCGSAPEVVLQLLSGRQLAAATGAAVAAGDVRLATLVAQAGQRGAVRADLEAQLAVWQQAGFRGLVAPERYALYQLLAGQVLEAQRHLALDWRRLLGVCLWYATPATASPAAALQQYLLARQMEPAIVPHPAPLHAEGLQQAATVAAQSVAAATAAAGATDVQWELLHVWSTTLAAATADCLSNGTLATASGMTAVAARQQALWLEGGGCSRLLRCAGYSPNPLDYSLSWHLLTVLQSLGVLPSAGEADPHGEGPTGNGLEDLLAPHLELISQLQLAGGLCEWALYVALHVPDLPPGLGGSAVRQGLVRELLAAHAPEWAGDSSKSAFLADTLRLPGPLLAEARATWAHYNGDHMAHCEALLAAGEAPEAHRVLVAHVAPTLFLAGSWRRLAELVASLEPYAASLPSWDAGGGLYGAFLAAFGQQQQAGGSAAAPAATGGGEAGEQELLAFGQQLQAAQQVLVEQQQDLAAHDAVRQRLVLNRMASRVQARLLFHAPAAGAAGTEGAAASAALQGGLALGCVASELQMGGLAAAAAAAGARVMC